MKSNSTLSLTPVSLMESNWPAKLTTWFPDEGEDEYQFFIREGDYWREVARFIESEIGSVLATGMFDQYPNTVKMLKDIAELAINNEYGVCNVQ